MKVLALETSTLTGSVALLSDDVLMGEITQSVSLQHSERLMPAVHRLLNDACVTAKDLDLVAVACGPGSFTGLRVGIAAAQGLSSAAGIPLVGVSSLAGLSLNAIFFDGLVVPLLNAFRGEVYRGIYRMISGWPEAVVDDGVVDPAALLEEVRGHAKKILFLGNGLPVIFEALQKEAGMLDWRAAPLPLMMPRASNIGHLALQNDSKDRSSAPVMPVYLRKAG